MEIISVLKILKDYYTHNIVTVYEVECYYGDNTYIPTGEFSIRTYTTKDNSYRAVKTLDARITDVVIDEFNGFSIVFEGGSCTLNLID